MRVKLIVRLLDAAGALLAWAAVQAEANGDGHLRPLEPFDALASHSGDAVLLVLHWPDLHIQKRAEVQAQIVAGARVTFVVPPWAIPSDEGLLPAVTVGQPIAVAVPPGALGVVGLR
jgi:hypothetical protein